MGNCISCKYYKVYATKYCSKQQATIYNTELECPYYKKCFIYWLCNLGRPNITNLSDNCRKEYAVLPKQPKIVKEK